MKYLFSSLLALSMALSCSRNDDAPATATPTPAAVTVANDKIVGTWKLSDNSMQNTTTGVITSKMTQCSTSQTYTFTSKAVGDKSGALSATYYTYKASNCEPTIISNNTWENTGAFYNITYKDVKVQTTIVFSNNDKTMVINTNDGTVDKPYIVKETYNKQ